MTILKDSLIAVVAAAFLLLALVYCTAEPAYAAPALDWPPKRDATISVSVVCGAKGYEMLNNAFVSGTAMDEINILYQGLITTRECVSLGSYTVEVKIVDVSEPMFMASGEIVYALKVHLDGAPEHLYTFVLNTPKQGISL